MNPVRLFEEEMEGWLNVKHVRMVCNGTAALHSAIVCSGVKPGDVVVTTPYTFPATANAIIMAGAYPLFVDVKKDLTLDMAQVEEALTGKYGLRVKCVIPVHIFGEACDMSRLQELRDLYGFIIVEDASQAVGKTIDVKADGYEQMLTKKALGTIGDAGTMSFYASKNLSCFEGGAVVTDSDSIALAVEQLRNHGLQDGLMVRFGYNYKMSWINAFIGWQNLKLHKPGILAELGRYTWRDGYYPKLVYQHPWYEDKRGLCWDRLKCPVAEEAARRLKQ